MGAFVCSALIIFFVYHFGFDISVSRLLTPWAVSLITTICFSPAFYWGRAVILTSGSTKPFYLVCGAYVIVMLMLFIYYGTRLEVTSPNKTGAYYLIIVFLVPVMMVAAYYGNKLMFRRHG